MANPGLASRIRGCVLGAALGDAIGAAFEFSTLQALQAQTGKDWIDGLYPYLGDAGALGLWRGRPPVGAGTDDTRYNWLFLSLAADLGRMPGARDLALRFLDVYRNPEAYFPGHAQMASQQFRDWEPACRGYLGEPSTLYPGVPPDVLHSLAFGNTPLLLGLIVLMCAGICYPGQPERAYMAAYEADFVDIGYAREAVAVQAAGVSLALDGEVTPAEIVQRIAGLDPFHLGPRAEWAHPYVRRRLPALCARFTQPRPAPQAAQALAESLLPWGPFDAFKAVAIAFASLCAAQGNALQAILIAVNHRGLDVCGNPAPDTYQDIDCYGNITGALAGAFAGAEAFPPGLLQQVVEANREVYGFDLEATLDRFLARCL